MSSTRFSTGKDGFLIVDKPSGLRSTVCVSWVKRAFGKGVKVGHAGTLDSTAQGLLVILVGKATRLCRYVMDLPKTYLGVVKFGVRTSTDDGTGEILSIVEPNGLTYDLLNSLVPSFLGTRMQRPPSISALKVDGRRAHVVSRSESPLRLSSRPTFITSMKILSFSGDRNEATVEIVCHKGTYIRSIARDMGDMIGCGAHLSYLKRLSTGPFHLSESIHLDGEELRWKKEILALELLPVDFISRAYTSYSVVHEDDLVALKNGLSIPISRVKLLKRSVFVGGSKAMIIGDEMLSMCDCRFTQNDAILVPETNIFMEGESI